jgi:spore coat polysaccharide biosynthesis predicted glycosyltransferase SpsG/RimJ/RimL family protein N-acetyltransferase
MAVLVLRAEGGAGMGAGHLARCLALAEAWREGGGEAVLVSAACPPEWEARFRAAGVAAHPPGPELPAGDWTVVDGYDLHLPEPRPSRVAVIDDHGRAAVEGADVIVDPNVGAGPGPYPGRTRGDDLLVGPRFALLRRELREALAAVGPDGSSPEPRLLVALGGAPARLHAHNVDVALRDPRLAALAVERLDGRDEVSGAMQRADLALAGAGVTASELCAFGVPAVLLALADNQKPVVDAVVAAGAAVAASPLDPPGMAQAVSALAQDADRRRAMGAAGRALVDGRGALRVAARLRADLLRLRAARPDDEGVLFEWVNDPDVRRTALRPGPVTWETHVAWFAARLADPACRLWIVEDDGGTRLGQVRIDGSEGEVEISVGLSAAARGRRWGPAAIDGAVRRAFAETTATTVVARIRPENRASVLAFGDAGFTPDGEDGDGAVTWLRYARAR